MSFAIVASKSSGPGSFSGRISKWLATLILAIATVALSGCGPSTQEVVDQQVRLAQNSVALLGRQIADGRLRNANLVRQYAIYIMEHQPDVKDIAEQIGAEGTVRGLAYNSLVDRLKKVDKKPKDDKAADKTVDELLRIEAAADPSVFDDSLIDVLNVLADMSNGKLPRLNTPRNQERSKEGAGSHLVGNPRYGHWQTDGSGNSFWVWYGRYALFRDVFWGPSRYYYSDWYPRRHWSYYGDVGRYYYGTRSDSSRWDRAAKTYPNTAPRKTYGGLKSARRLSTYGRASARTPGSSLKRASSYASSSRSSRSRGGK